MDVSGYRHNYGGFVKSSYASINKERTTKIEGSHASLVRILSFILFFLEREF